MNNNEEKLVNNKAQVIDKYNRMFQNPGDEAFDILKKEEDFLNLGESTEINNELEQFELTSKTELASLLEEFKLTNKNFLNDTDEFKENLLKSYS